MEKIEIEPDALEMVARRSGGGMRDALSLLDQASLLAQPGQPVTLHDLLKLMGAVHEDVLLEISDAVCAHDGGRALAAVHKLLLEGREPAIIAMESAKHFLNISKASYVATADMQTGGGDDTTSFSMRSIILGSVRYIESVVQQSKKFERVELAQIVEQLDRLEQACKRSSQPSLNLEIGILSLCHRHENPDGERVGKTHH